MNSEKLESYIETSRYFLYEKMERIRNGSYERDGIPEGELLAPQEIVSKLKQAWIRHNTEKVDRGIIQLRDSIERVQRLISYKNGLQKTPLNTPEEAFLLRILNTECNRDKDSFGWLVDSMSDTLHILQCEGISETASHDLQERYNAATADYSDFTLHPNRIEDEPFKGIGDFLSKYIKIVEEYASLVEENMKTTFNDASNGLNLFKKSNKPCNEEFSALLDGLQDALNTVERNWRLAINNLKKMERFAGKIEELANKTGRSQTATQDAAARSNLALAMSS